MPTNPSHTQNPKLQLLLFTDGLKHSFCACEDNSNCKNFSKPLKLATNYSHNSFCISMWTSKLADTFDSFWIFFSSLSFYKQLKVLTAYFAMYWHKKTLFHTGFHKPYAGKYLQLGKDKIWQNCCFKSLNVFLPVSKGEMFSHNSVIFWWVVIVSGKYQHLSFSKQKYTLATVCGLFMPPSIRNSSDVRRNALTPPARSP